MSSFSAGVVEDALVYCLRDVLLHGYVCVCACVCLNMCGRATCSMCVRTFNAILAHCGIVNSLLSKLLNGVTSRAGALSFFFVFAFILESPLCGQRTTGGRIGNKYIYFSFWRSSLMRGTCEAQASDFGKDYLCPSTPHLCHTGLVKPLCDW